MSPSNWAIVDMLIRYLGLVGEKQEKKKRGNFPPLEGAIRAPNTAAASLFLYNTQGL